MNPSISVIIPVYNAEKYVSRCIASVQAQTYSHWQMILVDDGSKDKSLEICQKYAGADNRIHVIHQENAGPGIARNVGLEYAKGKYVVFIDSDDYIEKDYFQLLSEHDEDVVYIDVRNVDESGSVLKEDYMSANKGLSLDSILRRQMTGSINWGGVRKCLKLRVLQENNIKYTNHKIGEEALYSFQVLWFAKSVAFIDRPLYSYVQRNDSQSHLKMDDPWGGVALALKNKVQALGIYELYANTLNAFFLTAAAVSANCLALNYPWKEYNTKIRERKSKLDDSLDSNYQIDKPSMSTKARVIGWLLQHELYGAIWMLSKLKNLKK